MNNKLTVIVVLAIILIVAGVLLFNSRDNTQNNSGNETAEELAGSITVAGSTSVQPLSDELAKVFMEKNPQAKVFVQGGGSGAGIKAAANGTADIGASSRELKDSEKGIYETTICKDGIAVVIHKSNPVENLSIQEVQDIFAGKTTNWKQVGGGDKKIVVVNREAGSGTRGAFEEIVMGKTTVTTDGLVQASTGAVKSTVAITEEAIGYISLSALEDNVKDVMVDGVAISKDNVLNNSYKISRPFIYLTKEAPNGLVKSYIDFVLSSEGQEIVAKDLIPVK